MKPFRKAHILTILKAYDLNRGPLDQFLSQYLRANKAIGSKDRAEISQTIYHFYRSFAKVNALSKSPLTWENRLEAFLSPDFQEAQLPVEIEANLPKELFNLLVKDYGLDKAIELGAILNQTAPITLRANTLKTSREALMNALLEEGFEVTKSPSSETALFLQSRQNLLQHPLFKAGHFEMQDEASQLAALLVDPTKVNCQILDYCAGSGGKTLAFAPLMKGKGQIHLHDIRESALVQAKKRLKRAGVQNAQIVPPSSPNLEKLKGKMDIVFVDAPCSGSGTYRRSPEQKWRFSLEMLSELVFKQREIVKEAMSYLRRGGTLIYATCSLLKEENEKQVLFFEKHYGLKRAKDPLSLLPVANGSDGFFATCLSKG